MKFRFNIILSGIVSVSYLSINSYAETAYLNPYVVAPMISPALYPLGELEPQTLYKVPKGDKEIGIYNDAVSSGLTKGELSLARELAKTHNEDLEKKFSNAKQDIIYAQLADAIYQDTDTVIPNNWELIDTTKFGIGGAEGGVFQNTVTGEKVLAFAGTDSASDIADDIALTFSLPSSQQGEAISYARNVFNIHGHDIKVVGHSLGGHLAQTVAVVHGKEAITFNSASVGTASSAILTAIGANNSDKASIRNYVMTEDNVNPGSKLLGLTGKDYGEKIYIDAYEPTLNPFGEHGIKTVIKNMDAMGKFHDVYEAKYKPQFNNIDMLGSMSANTQNRTSHIGVSIPTPNDNSGNQKVTANNQELAFNRQTSKENFYNEPTMISGAPSVELVSGDSSNSSLSSVSTASGMGVGLPVVGRERTQ